MPGLSPAFWPRGLGLSLLWPLLGVAAAQALFPGSERLCPALLASPEPGSAPSPGPCQLRGLLSCLSDPHIWVPGWSGGGQPLRDAKHQTSQAWGFRPSPLEPLSRALEEVLLFTGQGGGGGEQERGDAVCKIPPLPKPSGPRVLGVGGRRGAKQRRLDLEANCAAAATLGEALGSSRQSAPRASSEG